MNNPLNLSSFTVTLNLIGMTQTLTTTQTTTDDTILV